MLNWKMIFDIEAIIELSKQYPDVSLDVRRAKMHEAILFLERNVKESTPEGAGPIHIRDTIHGKVMSYGMSVRGILGTPAEYGDPLEYGSQPHFPPVGPIIHWVERKLGFSGDEAESIAYAIAWKIYRHGTKGAHMFDTGFETGEYQVLRILDGIPEEIVRRVSAQ